MRLEHGQCETLKPRTPGARTESHSSGEGSPARSNAARVGARVRGRRWPCAAQRSGLSAQRYTGRRRYKDDAERGIGHDVRHEDEEGAGWDGGGLA